MSVTAPAIRIEGASLRFDTVTVFDGLDVEIAGGAWTCLLGPSGVGKTSLLRLVAGLDAEGAAAGGRVVADDGAPLAGRIAYMAQRDLLLPWASVLDNVLLGPRLRGDLKGARARDLRERALFLLERVGLAERASAMPAELSGGMRQRTALARTLLEDRPVVLMDEPFAALDALSRYRLQAMAVELLAGRTVLLVTHDPLEALRVADRVEVLHGAPARLARPAIIPSGDAPRATDAPEIARLHRALLERLAGGAAIGGAESAMAATGAPLAREVAE
ncbi:ABC transporter ATP-binding protein [Marivibrio halodurans]|uniref:ABC transporter ATP-binding protein n=1 Tax=Marivibrio halodurans TaxID=2039722 RepID=A0A8J7V3J9_9PROT|nr:ABC transporter ATP-binding protein [Marivibrio halodurans]MBP5858326.1 ABC transporter ATP-binding protein [Marivibrio halodurans]